MELDWKSPKLAKFYHLEPSGWLLSSIAIKTDKDWQEVRVDDWMQEFYLEAGVIRAIRAGRPHCPSKVGASRSPQPLVGNQRQVLGL